MTISFDGPTKVATLSAGTVTLSVRDLWSRWVDWFLTGDNSKYGLWMSNLGGDDIDLAAGTKVPIYLFLQPGVTIKPQEASHTLAVNDGVLLVAGGGDPFANTTGSYIVRINYQQPVQAISFSATGGTGITAADIWQRIIENGLTAEQIMRILAAGMAGKTAGFVPGAVGSGNIRDLADTKNRIVAGHDANGNRTSIVLDPT